MTTIITYARNGWGSAPKISSLMKQENEVIRVRRGEHTKPCDLLIRWASRVNWSHAGKVINPARGIGLASNKAGARLLLQENNVPVPRTAVLGETSWVGWNFPVVVRPFYHRAGNEFYVLGYVELEQFESEQLGQSDWYVSEFYPKTHEYRVHVAHGRVLLVNEKVPREGQEEKRSEPIWNHATNDFEFKVLRWRDLPVEAMRIAIQACEVLGLDYAGVDVMTGAEPPAVICEVNCSPTLEDYAAEQYAIYFDWLVRTGGKEEHFPMPNLDVHPQTYIFRQEVNLV